MKNQDIFFKRLLYISLCFAVTSSCSSTGPNPSKDSPKSYTVEIVQMKFEPAQLKVKKGDTVLFINRDMVMHNITEEAKKEWSSSPLQTQQSWTLLPTESVNYFCSLHPVMKGSIVVE